MDYCISCDKDSVVFGKTKIKIGRQTFETKAEHCKKCGQVAIGPELQAEIDEWGSKFTKAILELQPYFAESINKRIIEYSAKFSLNKTEFMKACTVFYLTKLSEVANFKSLRATVLEKAQSKYSGKRVKICVPIKYQLFKKIELYARVWHLEYDANVMEEAVTFCVSVLDTKADIDATKKAELIHFVEEYAMAS